MQENQLHTHALWEATKTIPPEKMTILGKECDQIQKYCNISIYELRQHSTGDTVRDIFHKIAKVESVRMIRLTVLRKYYKDYKPDDVLHYSNIFLGVKVGGFVFNN